MARREILPVLLALLWAQALAAEESVVIVHPDRIVSLRTAEIAQIRPMTPPSVHVRAIATWVTIFPLVALGMTVMGPLTTEWHPVLRALVLTLIVVPLAVYVIVPRVLGLYGRLRRP